MAAVLQEKLLSFIIGKIMISNTLKFTTTLRKVLWPKGEEVRGEWKRLNKEKLHLT